MVECSGLRTRSRRLATAVLGLGSLAACSSLAGRAPSAPIAPRWIWSQAEPRDAERAWFSRSFECDAAIERATLWATCDNEMEVFVNGNSVLASEEWWSPFECDVTAKLRSGTNVLAVRAWNDSGPAGLIASLTLVHEDGSETCVVTDATWRVTGSEPASAWTVAPAASPDGWRTAIELGEEGIEPWGELAAPVPWVASRALAADALELAEGFRAELVYNVPRASQGSWVSLCADDRGRLYASDQYGGLYRITPPEVTAGEPPTAPPLVESLDVALGEAHGLLWAFDSLYVVVSAAGEYESGLYRVRDTDGDDRLDAVELLRTFEGDGEHGPHAVLLAPSGDALYVLAGNHVALPSYVQHSRVPRLWDEDLILPRLDDPNGHAVGVLAPGGWICKTDPDGVEWELVACGFRNTYDAAFASTGELFTFDADMEWDIGLPWYRPTRILHVTSGAEFGWRAGSGKWPAFYPDSLGPVVEIGPASPTGVVFGSNARFRAPWRDALFVADWTFGTIYAVHLEAHGASWTGRFEPFVRGEPLPVTDLAIGADGALYFTTGGRRTQSGLYRVVQDGVWNATDAPRAVPVAEAVERRRALEALHEGSGRNAQESIWSELNDRDRVLRFAARTALELQDPADWRERALAEERFPASIEAMLALVRRDAELPASELFERLERWPWERFERDELLAAMRVVELGLIRRPGAESFASPCVERLAALLPTGDDDVDRELCKLLSRAQHSALAAKGTALLEAAPSQEAAIDYAYALACLRSGWDDASRARLLRWFDEDSPALEGGVSFGDYLRDMRAMALESLGISMPVVADPRTPIQHAPPETRESAPLHNWTTDELLPDLSRLKGGRSFERGRELFVQTRCLECHRVAGEGGGTGPDLSSASSRFSPRDLLDALLAPSATVSDQYRDTEVWTDEGSVLVGRIVGQDGDFVTLRLAQGDERVEIATDEIVLQRAHPLSRMPEGLLDRCSKEEVLDLLAYVLAGGDATDAAFR